ncbi:FabD/lysophospholipase-like protein [Armillaria luteobubalina]|uniref:FabD/lysophospholipase-like protein n=1 Tax=Armillaria luteobubalina TaxID=153913 RepID=A0AA39PVA6_9AGAR|nr:FabD/lysophospholipase-like protein [Armillaria luteobubalina]KAK0489818.1 FabD/lysophospholipase-like protein [Armillaria luteobubalina]
MNLLSLGEHTVIHIISASQSASVVDGGGIRDVSELFILEEIMKRIQLRKTLPNTPGPCGYFDLIGGTSTGGLIAIMLGRLKMSTEEAPRSYNKISSTVFWAENTKPFYRDGKFKASTLVKEIENVVRQAGHSSDQNLLDAGARRDSKGNAYVPSPLPKHRPHSLRQFRPDCKIWEAARATTTVPIFFKAIKITSGFGPDYVDAGLGINNTTKEVRDDAKDLFGPNRRVGVLVSIGTGHPGPSGFQQSKGIERVLPLEFIRVLQRITTDCENVADELAKEYRSGDTYLRFNILHRAEGVSLDEWKKMSEIMAHTSSYLRGPDVSREIDRVVACLCSSLSRTR